MTTKAYREAVRYAESLGLVSEGWNGTGHHVFRNAETGDTCTLSGSMPDQARALENTLAMLRRCAGLDSRGREAVEGARRDKRTLGRLGSGFNFSAVRRDRSRKRKLGPGYSSGSDRAELLAEREQLWLKLLACESRTSTAERLAHRVVEIDLLLGATDESS